MDTLLGCVAGLDVHKKFITVCVRRTDLSTGQVSEQVERFGTMTGDLLNMAQWLAQAGVSHVAMESTGVYWKPVWNVLEGRFQLLLANAHQLKQVPGRKSDIRDCQWIAHLLSCGLLKGSFVPPQGQRELRDLTRYRACLIDERTRAVNRVQKLLEDTNVKLASVASDVMGMSGREMLAALVEGEADVERLANMARGRMREKIPQLQQALVGHVTKHHQFLLGQLLAHVDHLDAQIAELDERIQEALRPFLDEAGQDRLDAIPGVNRRTIENVVAEIGVDMGRFPSAGHLSSWAGECPAHEQSGGKIQRRTAKQGNRWLRRTLAEAARAASRAKNTYFQAQYRRLAARRGANRAAMAVAHSMLVVIYHLLKDPAVQYRELGGTYFDQLDPQRLQRHLIKRLEALGLHVVVTPQCAA